MALSMLAGRSAKAETAAGAEPAPTPADITSNTYYDWVLSRAYILVPAQAYVGQFLETFKTFPPRQKPASFTVGGQMEALERSLSKLQGDID